jgi:hypothetical protein
MYRKRFTTGITSHDSEGQSVPQSALYHLETQESWCCTSQSKLQGLKTKKDKEVSAGLIPKEPRMRNIGVSNQER